MFIVTIFLQFRTTKFDGEYRNMVRTKLPKSHGRLVGYARVSTEDQSLALQLKALREAGVLEDNLHIEKRSGASMQKRPELQFAIKDCRDGDILVVWRLDRLTRSLPDLYNL